VEGNPTQQRIKLQLRIIIHAMRGMLEGMGRSILRRGHLELSRRQKNKVKIVLLLLKMIGEVQRKCKNDEQ
jgi:hypothetical protein